MKNLIISLILKYWDRTFMIDLFKKYTYSDLAFEIVNLSTMLDILKIKQPHIILNADNSFKWIVVYLTAIIKEIPLTILPKFEKIQISHFINESNGNILFTDNIDNGPLIHNRSVIYQIYINKNMFDLIYIRHGFVKQLEKKVDKWKNLSCITDRSLTPKLFKKFKEQGILVKPEMLFEMYSSGVNNSPRISLIPQRTVLRAMKGMIRLFAKNKIRNKLICVKADFSFFASITFLPILGVGGTILLNGNNFNIKATIADTQWYEEMWSFNTEFMSESKRMWLERWQLTKWINTIKLRNYFKYVFGDNMDTFIILNDQTHSCLRKNLERIGYKVFSTYGITKTAQLISIDKQLIKGTEIRIESNDPTKVGGKLYVSIPFSYISKAWINTKDVASIGKDSELIIHGRRKSRIKTKNGHTIYPEEIERIIKSHPLITQCIVFEKDDKIILGLHFNSFILDMKQISRAESINLAIQIKDELNDYLPKEMNIDSVIPFPKLLDTNVQGKIIRYFSNTPEMFGAIRPKP